MFGKMKEIKRKLTSHKVANLGFHLQERGGGHMLVFQPAFISSPEMGPSFVLFLFLENHTFPHPYFIYSG